MGQEAPPRPLVWRATLRAKRFRRNKANVRKYLLRLAVFSLSATIGAVSALCQRETEREWPPPQGELKGAVDPIRRMYVSELDPDLPTSLAPYDIRNFVSREPDLSLLKLWKALNIDPNEFDGVQNDHPGSFSANATTARQKSGNTISTVSLGPKRW